MTARAVSAIQRLGGTFLFRQVEQFYSAVYKRQFRHQERTRRPLRRADSQRVRHLPAARAKRYCILASCLPLPSGWSSRPITDIFNKLVVKTARTLTFFAKRTQFHQPLSRPNTLYIAHLQKPSPPRPNQTRTQFKSEHTLSSPLNSPYNIDAIPGIIV